jgi:hypothetical protein
MTNGEKSTTEARGSALLERAEGQKITYGGMWKPILQVEKRWGSQ